LHSENLQPFRRGLAGTLLLIKSKLVPSFVDNVQFTALLEQAASLPSIHRAGFEYSLLGNSKGLDFQQAIEFTAEDLAEIPDPDSPGRSYPALQRICQEWKASDTGFTRLLDQIWLEFDSQTNGAFNEEPVYFLGLKKLLFQAHNQLAFIQACHELLAAKPLPELQYNKLRQVLFSLPEGRGISHLGYLLSRPDSPTRLVLPLRTRGDLMDCLCAVAWPGDHAAARSLTNWLFEQYSELRLCLDIGSTPAAQLGFECMFSTLRDSVSGITKALNLVRDASYCSAEEAEQLSTWAERVFPGQTGCAWPEDLILSTLACPETQFSVIDCRLSHLKFTLSQNSSVRVKSYFGFRHQLLEV